MTETVQFGDYTVEHHGMYSYVYQDGKLVRKFEGTETSWSDAERWASDQMFKARLERD